MIPVASPCIGTEERKNVLKALDSGWISSKGPFVERFENDFASYCGARYAVSTSNGTASLHLALKALGVGIEDEVIVPALSFISTANVVTYCNAKPVFADSNPDYWCIGPEEIAKKITKRTKAIIPVHLYGHPCDMKPIMEIARDNKLFVVEDCAEAIGSEYRGRKVGRFGDVGCFSFYGNKTITTGEGGMCTTNSKKLSERIRILKNYGMNPSRKYWHDVIGFNYRMTNIQAAIGVAQMKKISRFVGLKRRIAQQYAKRLQGTRGLTLPSEMPWAKNTFWMYTILIEKEFGVNVERLMKRLGREGVETRPLLKPTHLMPPYRTKERFPVAESLARRGLSLPSSVSLTDGGIEKICNVIKSASA
jgi:perosamine synthetase